MILSRAELPKIKINFSVLQQKLNQFPGFREVINEEFSMRNVSGASLTNMHQNKIITQWKNLICQKICNRCHIRNKKLKKCKQCRKVYYCSKKCQKLDWNIYCHNLSCVNKTA